MAIKRSDIAEAIFDTLSLYCVEQKDYSILKNLTGKELKPIQKEVEKLLKKHEMEINDER